MSPDDRREPSGEDRRRERRPLGPALGQAWVDYQRRLDAELAAAGFTDRRLPDLRVLRLCSRSPDLTAARVGRDLGISRQAAGKIVSNLRDRGFVTLEPSPDDAREKTVTLTPRGVGYLAAQREAVRRIQDQVRDAVGADAYGSLYALLDVLGGEAQPRLTDYLEQALRYLSTDP